MSKSEEQRSWCFRDWCKRRGISPAKAYEDLKNGRGPDTYWNGTRRMVSFEADQRYIAQREAEARAAAEDAA